MVQEGRLTLGELSNLEERGQPAEKDNGQKSSSQKMPIRNVEPSKHGPNLRLLQTQVQAENRTVKGSRKNKQQNLTPTKPSCNWPSSRSSTPSSDKQSSNNRSDRSERPGYRTAIRVQAMIEPEQDLAKLIGDITRRAISICRTGKAKAAFKTLASEWAVYHSLDLDIDEMVILFQRLLREGERNPDQWPLGVMDWTTFDRYDALYCPDPMAVGPKPGVYPVEEDVICLNGVRVWQLAQDTKYKRHDCFVRKFGLIWDYVHEMAHFFIEFINYQANQHRRYPNRRSPRDERNQIRSQPQEAGLTFERLLFGGLLHRYDDGGGREEQFQTGLPMLETSEGSLGIPLRDVLLIAAKNLDGGRGYESRDLILHPERVEMIKDNRTGCKQFFLDYCRESYPTFFRDYAMAFNHPFGYWYSEGDNFDPPKEVLDMICNERGIQNTLTPRKSKFTWIDPKEVSRKVSHSSVSDNRAHKHSRAVRSGSSHPEHVARSGSA